MNTLMCIAIILTATSLAGEEITASQPGLPVVEQAAICTAVADRSPVGTGEVFGSDVGSLWCFTRITGVKGESTISHVWYRGDSAVHEQPLMVRGPSWRTWSMKRIPSEWSGSWHVDVVAADGTVLKTIPFSVQ